MDGKLMKLLVHRKGATRAFPPHHPLIPVDYQFTGQPVLIGDAPSAGLPPPHPFSSAPLSRPFRSSPSHAVSQPPKMRCRCAQGARWALAATSSQERTRGCRKRLGAPRGIPLPPPCGLGAHQLPSRLPPSSFGVASLHPPIRRRPLLLPPPDTPRPVHPFPFLLHPHRIGSSRFVALVLHPRSSAPPPTARAFLPPLGCCASLIWPSAPGAHATARAELRAAIGRGQSPPASPPLAPPPQCCWPPSCGADASVPAANRNELKYEEVLGKLKTKGIAIRVASPKLVMEEAPESYKDVTEVVNTCHAAGISNKVWPLVEQRAGQVREEGGGDKGGKREEKGGRNRRMQDSRGERCREGDSGRKVRESSAPGWRTD